MAYSPPVYPATIPSTGGADPNLPDRVDDVDWLYAARYNELKKELIAIMGELGTLPKGDSSDVKTRLDAINPSEGIIGTVGTWTPTFTGQDAGITAVGNYLKLGKFILFQGAFLNIGSTAGAGVVKIGGLPETSVATSANFYGAFATTIYKVNYPETAKELQLLVSLNSKEIELYWSVDDGASLSAVGNDFDQATCQLFFIGFYKF